MRITKHNWRNVLEAVLVSTLLNGLIGSFGACTALFVAHLIWGEF